MTAQWDCGSCGGKRTAWYGTVQYRPKSNSETVRQAIHMQMKGVCAGEHSQGLHRSLFKALWLKYIQLDELASKVRNRSKQVWVWTGIDVTSRLWVVGERSQQEANQLLHQVYRRVRQDIIPAFTPATPSGAPHRTQALSHTSDGSGDHRSSLGGA